MPPGSRVRLGPRSALLLIDVVNPFDFESAPRLLRHARPAAGRIAALKRRARRAGVPVIYVNDNYGDWHAGFAELVARCLRPAAAGRDFVERVAPEPGDYYVLKPLHSGFQSTSLGVLLDRLAVETVVLTGVATHICVWFTAIDAYMRGLDVVIPRDCVASERAAQGRAAVAQMADVLKARVAPSRALVFPRSAGRRRPKPRSRARRSG